MVKLILFDFDGTLVDSVNLIADAYNEYAAGRKGLQLVPEDTEGRNALRAKGSREVLAYLGVRWYRLPFVRRAVRALIREKRKELAAYQGIPHVLSELKKRGYSLAILSSSPSPTITSFIRRNRLAVFDHLVCDVPLFGKRRAIERILGKTETKPSETIYVGDETRDVEAARAAGVAAVGVTWGANTRSTLEAAGADVVDTPHELLTVLSKNSG